MGLYEYVETGLLTGGPKQHLMEASLARQGQRWIVAARSGGMSFAQMTILSKTGPRSLSAQPADLPRCSTAAVDVRPGLSDVGKPQTLSAPPLYFKGIRAMFRNGWISG
jgi:hypothetical protein